MHYRNFILNELRDRKSQKGLMAAFFNITMFPMTVFINYLNYRKWDDLLGKLKLEERDLKESVEIKIIEENVSARKKWNKLGEYQPILKMNHGYIIEKNDLFIFPIVKTEKNEPFFTQIQEPIVVSNTKHPFETLWKIPTLINIESVRFKNGWTRIKLKGELFKNQIEIRIHKRITVANKG